MQTEIRTLIAALMTERDSLDRAITSLRAISDVRPESAPKAAANPAVRRIRRVRRISASTKAAIVAEMRQAKYGEGATTAQRIASQFGVSAKTIMSWRRWANGARHHADVFVPEATSPVEHVIAE